MKKKNLKNRLSLTIKDISNLTGAESKNIKGGATAGCPPWCETLSCPEPGGYSCGQFPCQSQFLSIAEC